MRDQKQTSKKRSGQVLIIALTLLSIMLVVGTAMMAFSQQGLKTTRHSYKTTQCLSLAEAGIDYGIRQINLDPNFSGTSTPVSLGNGEFEVLLTGSGITRELTSLAYIPNKINYEIKKELRANLNINNVNIHFPYGVQAGKGGIYMEPNSEIIGDIYSDGSIDGTTGNTVDGTVIVANDDNILTPVVWTTYNSDFIFGKTNPVIDLAQSFVSPIDQNINSVQLYLKKIGSPSDISIRVFPDSGNKPLRSTLMASGTLSSSGITGTYNWAETSMNNNSPLVSGTKYWIVVDATSDNNNYWQVGVDNTDSYSGQSALTSPNWNKNPSPIWNSPNVDLNFKVILANSGTYIKNVDVTKDAYAHRFIAGDLGRDFFGYQFTGDGTIHDIGRDARAKELRDCRVTRNAFADTNLCWVGGTTQGGSGEPDRSPADYPITDSNIADFKTSAAASVINGDYSPVGEVVNLGPVRIDGNLNLINNQKLNLTGTVYVTGKINFANSNIIALDPAYGISSGIIITDQPAKIDNLVQFEGSGQPSTYILLIDTSNSQDPSNPAIDIRQNADAAIVFAPDGLISLLNNVTVKETTGYRLYLKNGSKVIYESALQNILFSTGPAGGWRMKPGTWREIK